MFLRGWEQGNIGRDARTVTEGGGLSWLSSGGVMIFEKSHEMVPTWLRFFIIFWYTSCWGSVFFFCKGIEGDTRVLGAWGEMSSQS